MLAVVNNGSCQPFGFPSDMDCVWQTLHAVVLRVDDSVLEKIFSDYPRLVNRVIEQMTDEGSCQKRQALGIFQEAGTRIGTTLLKGKEIPRIEYLLVLLSKLFFSATAVESIRVLVLQTVLVLAETYPFPSSLYHPLKKIIHYNCFHLRCAYPEDDALKSIESVLTFFLNSVQSSGAISTGTKATARKQAYNLINDVFVMNSLSQSTLCHNSFL